MGYSRSVVLWTLLALVQVVVTPDLPAAPVPANLLRFYVHFPQPMARGRVLDKLHLFRDDGREVPMPFLDQELWDRDQRRLTVLIDPGRVKRGVAPQVELGEVLEAGRTYQLVVDRSALAANGVPMGVEFRRAFRVGPAVRQGIDPKQWRVTAAAESVVVEFDRMMDDAILEWALEVVDGAGRVVEGTIRRSATRWVFTPGSPLARGKYELRIDPAIEDVSGNRLGRPFDVDVAARTAPVLTTALAFEIR